jgi:hypothetical protein
MWWAIDFLSGHFKDRKIKTLECRFYGERRRIRIKNQNAWMLATG